MIEAIKELDIVAIIQALLVIVTAIAAVTPTEKDDSVVARVKNLVGKLTGK